MKKIIFLITVCFCAFGAFAQKTAYELWADLGTVKDNRQRDEWWKSRTDDEIRTIANEVLSIAKTNHLAACRKQGGVSVAMFRHWVPLKTHLAPEYDQKFADAKIFNNTLFWYYAPKCTIAYLESENGKKYEAEHPAWCDRIRRACRDKKLDMSVPCMANTMAECGSVFNCATSYNFTLDMWKNKILGCASRIVRHRLRDTGKPITTNGGVNPIQDALDRLTAALNAPKMSGLKEWCAEWCPDYRWIDIKWMSDEELKSYKDDIYYGDRQFGASEKFILCAYLGVDEYNKFVKRFNNED